MGSMTILLLVTAAIILLIKRYLIANIDSNFKMSKHLTYSFGIYKRMFLYLKYRLKSKDNDKSYNNWLLQQQKKE